MSFRLRVFLLTLVVAVVATGATAWFSLRITAQQIERSQQEATRHVADIAETARTYARRHGTWAGISRRVETLAAANKQRIRLVNLDGQVIVDSDNLARRAARPVVSPATLVNPRPTLTLDPKELTKIGAKVDALVLNELADYRRTVVNARCLTDVGVEPPPVTPDQYGIPLPAGGGALPGDCTAQADDAQQYAREGDYSATRTCTTAPDHIACLVQVFGDRAATFAPEPLQLYLGAVDDDAVTLLARPMMAAVGAVLVLAVIGTALVARYMSRPLRSLTAASRRLADGHLDTRVTTTGRDEVGELSRSFNRMAAALEGAELAQRRLLAGVAHELRTPMSNVLGYLEALQDGVVPPSRELFGSLHEEVQLQRRILDDLQDLTLAEAGHLAYRRTDFDLAELVEVSRVAHLAVAEHGGVRLTAEAAGPLPVHGDQDRLRQVLGNLVTNALRYTDPGGSVVLRAYPLHGRAIAEVRDTGCGIAPQDLPHVFHRFWRADPARDRETGGSGLGLTIARQIVLDHAGTIEVTSTLGEGSTFRVTFPIVGP
ncbi:HAMP domain-containing protein [Dactylosporangium vinaceum]|uniref:histidine kinase n=1 Tax=Dactylosporangium vinaceum TaxID=53362 RepID=A0ABV5M4K4_9ACTN|nr:ATP-binding protein [Dactylosporangium vinaceum]UAB93438.1 HAMP domain-containing protein [Dactylosporangium vinaceum]